ncbi:nitrogen fixation protein NifQ [Bradyrhizobium canariense]|uniref:nitrogen fixation protein NifQ n=1 Tax=Bradyrhizobium canariense TaxID=255045 RepID=UPI000A18EA7A|nr:nitrogen fixation protein NifQ [Bradyrhizobium canariense]OSI22299.1 nitrogen fixation protein NifQ [Bradyrhizobium canariense]OSI26890.1 nitrogen fixation protein NifQ [Bradyrhizobium canariense]OSI39359.1 nitrogen fixation protein NifQ [Bradyrhizobium canariense]OSI45790.1 nitrogen fixation protein NifQ [Bradyrhizobium canariense]OSI55470.1 nitrogen fixation protein NifQ [Bradyrhizobium canariense]
MIGTQGKTADTISSRVSVAHAAEQRDASELYQLLTGRHPAEVDISDNDDFDHHVLACILATSAMDGGQLPERAGLTNQELNALLVQYFPSTPVRSYTWRDQSALPAPDETVMVRDLLLAQRSTRGEVGGWLATMIARRAMEPNHLWEDLGLRKRDELSRVLMRHFGPLAARNTKNMRWKRFFYRMLCEDDGLVMCTTPVCTECNDFDLCFGEESGESRMAGRRRDHLRRLDDAVQAVPSLKG